jgi:hypothetical protein
MTAYGTTAAPVFVRARVMPRLIPLVDPATTADLLLMGIRHAASGV